MSVALLRKSAQTWLLAFRPKTLTAAVVPVLVGTAVVYSSGSQILWWVSALALLASVFIQIATNLLNDAIDFKKGADTHERIGPKRVTQSGLISPRTVMLGGFAFLMLALACGIPLVMQGGWPIFVIGVVSVFLAYGYTGGPFPLAYLGLGDIFVFIFFGLIAVSGLFYLHTGFVSAEAVIAGTQVGLLATVLIAINNLRDIAQDRVANKRTLAVRFGESFVRIEIITLVAMSLGLGLFWILRGEWVAGLLPLVLTPVAIKLVNGIRRVSPSAELNLFLAQSAKLQLGFGILLALGLGLR
jgi:1,4-dihydroxy-2-naphthoate polyprenyltransferase